MGDQLCSEPVIRYTQKIYPDANIIAVTHFPRLFEHLDIPVLKYNDWKGSQEAVLVLYTCPDDEKSEHHLSHVLFHPTDFAAMSMIKRTIPDLRAAAFEIEEDVILEETALLKNTEKSKISELFD